MPEEGRKKGLEVTAGGKPVPPETQKKIHEALKTTLHQHLKKEGIAAAEDDSDVNGHARF